ncbi:MAG: DUF1016 family protein [Actinobacteria bacterium]|nr:DUF1016 family protein [Actinomycetota bacterium]
MEELRFDGRVAVITGAGRGLGREYALLLASRGARVVVNDLGVAISDTDDTGEAPATNPADEVVAEIIAAGGVAVADHNTVATVEGGESIIATALEAFGTVDICVNNAGQVRMQPFATFPDERILVSLIRELSWTHFIALMPLKDPLQRDYYAQMASTQRWSVRTLRERIDSMLYERTALSQKPEETIAQELATLRDAQRMSPALVMRDPYILDFLGLRDTWQEGDLEAAIIREMESFLLELGAGFSFVARQKRIPIDDEDFHLDLLFYNRKLRRLVAVELKVGDFKAAYKGQMELYLRWLDKHEREPEEASPLGIILCTGKKREQIELLELDKSGIHVAEYLTALPPRGVLVERLQQATQRAQLQIEQRKTDNE